MNLQENISRIKEVMGLMNESVNIRAKRRAEGLLNLAKSTFPYLYPCDFDREFYVDSILKDVGDVLWDADYDDVNLPVGDVRDYLKKIFSDHFLKHWDDNCDRKNKEEETEGVGAYAAPAFEMEPDHVHFKHIYNEKQEMKERCWPGYTQKGMKTMFGKRYPNCVKKSKK